MQGARCQHSPSIGQESQGPPTRPAPERRARPAPDHEKTVSLCEGEGKGVAGDQDQDQVSELDPDGLWFDAQSVAGSITKTIKSYFFSPWKNYTEVDDTTKLQWWNMWKKMYRWRPELESHVQSLYEKKAAVTPKDLHNDVVHKRSKRPEWLGDPLYKQMKAGVLDEKFIPRSARARANMRGGNIDARPPPSHYQGSVSTIARAKKLAKDKGKMPNAADLFLDTHFKTVPGKDPIPISQKAKNVMEKYEQNISDSQASGTEKDPNEAFFEAVGGWQKGELLGFGKDGASLYYERSSRRPVGSSSSYAPSVSAQLSQITERLEASKRARQELEERDRVQEERERAREEQMKKQMDYAE